MEGVWQLRVMCITARHMTRPPGFFGRSASMCLVGKSVLFKISENRDPSSSLILTLGTRNQKLYHLHYFLEELATFLGEQMCHCLVSRILDL